MNKQKMNRQQKRAAVSSAKKKAKAGWEPLQRVHGVINHPLALPGMTAAWHNHTYSAQVFEEVDTALGRVVPIGVRRHDGGASFPWHDLQRIKSQLAGAEGVAVEVFPAETDLVDQANLRWLWVLPAGARFKFTLPKRV